MKKRLTKLFFIFPPTQLLPMKKLACCLSILLSLSPFVQGQFTTNLVIDGSTLGVSQPGDLGKFAILDYTIDEGGLLNLNHAFANSGGSGVAAWGDTLDFTGGTGLSGGVSVSFGIRIYGINNNGVDAPVKSNEDKGMGVSGNNPSRLDWGQVGTSESLRVEVTSTGIPSNLQLIITGLQFGNANAIAEVLPEAFIGSLVNVTGYTGALGAIATVADAPQDFTIPGGGLLVASGDGTETVASFTLTQALQPPSGSVGFSLQGITFDVVPVTPVPEPSAIAFLLGISAIGFVLWRRR
jgi:hypothetical protein